MLIHFENLIASAWIRNPPGLIICGQGGEVLQYVELPFGGYGQGRPGVLQSIGSQRVGHD